MSAVHKWKFFRVGGVDQVVLESGDDIAHLPELDLKLWIAIAMPVKGIALDPKTAGFLDREGDGRIRAQDILAAVEWLKARVASFDDIAAGKGEIAVENLIGETLKKSAKRIAGEEGGNGNVVTINQIEAADKRFSESQFNGDGVIVTKTTTEADIVTILDHIVATFGGVTDRCGLVGVDADKVKAYFDDATALRDWMKAESSAEVVKALGPDTASGAALVRKLTPKIVDYFARTHLAAFDERVIAASHGSDAQLAELANRDLAATSPEIVKMPVARIIPYAPLPFEGPVNPAFAADLVAFRDTVARPILGATTNELTEAGFATIKSKLASYESWLAAKPATKLGDIARARLDEILDGKFRTRIDALIATDAEHKDELDRILEVEKLVFLHRDFMSVVRNFVSFSDLYSRKLAIFQAGTLYLDGRGCSLCIEVTDVAKHATLASLSSAYLAYCDLRRKDQPNRTVVAAFTAGDSDNLMVGRNGVFVDRDGSDWDATIARVVENPISIRQAFFAPYKKFVRLVEEQVQKRASDADAEAQTRVSTAAQETANADRLGATVAAGTATAPAAPPRRIDIGTVAAIGVAVGGIGAMVTGLVSAFFGLGVFMPLGVLGLILMISGPSMILAYLKLRKRNLGPILDASGWAINGLATINVPFGGALTDLATLPPGSDRLLHDPYAERRKPWKLYTVLAIVLVLFVGWSMGRFDPYLPWNATAARIIQRRDPPARNPTTEPARPSTRTR